MIRAFNTIDNFKYKLIRNETLQLPPFTNVLILELDTDNVSKMAIRLIFSTNGKEFSLASRKSDDGKYLDYYFYNWNSENFVDLKKPLIITKNSGEKVYSLNLSIKLNTYTNIRTIIFTLWQVL